MDRTLFYYHATVLRLCFFVRVSFLLLFIVSSSPPAARDTTITVKPNEGVETVLLIVPGRYWKVLEEISL